MLRLSHRESCWLIAFWGLVVATALTASRIIETESAGRHVQMIIEAGVYLALLMFLAGIEPLKAGFRALKPSRRVVIVLFAGGMLVAQLAKSTHASYPFVAWNMYAQAPPSNSVVFVELAGKTTSGAIVNITPESVLPSLNRYRLTMFVRKVAVESTVLSDETARHEAKAQFQHTLIALLDLYNERHPQDPLSELRVTLGHFDYTQYAGDEHVSRTLLHRWKLQ